MSTGPKGWRAPKLVSANPPGLIAAGANDGEEYIGSSRPLVLIEPQASPYRRLQKNFGAMRSATLVNVALGSEPGRADMRVSNFDKSSSLLEPLVHLELYGDVTFDQRETVQVRTLDAVMSEVDGEFSDLVIDVQGYELEVFKGAPETLARLETIKCEVNTAEVFKGCALMHEIDDFLANFGFARVHTDLYGRCWGDATYGRKKAKVDLDA